MAPFIAKCVVYVARITIDRECDNNAGVRASKNVLLTLTVLNLSNEVTCGFKSLLLQCLVHVQLKIVSSSGLAPLQLIYIFNNKFLSINQPINDLL